MNSERHLTPLQKLARRRAPIRARHLKSRVLRMHLSSAERLAERRARARTRGLRAQMAADSVSWEFFANDEEAMAFVEEMADAVLASLPPWKGDC